jgi:hypothetical protein
LLSSPARLELLVGSEPPSSQEECLAMPICPHCGQEIEVGSLPEGERPYPAEKVAWSWREKGLPQVSLGCGSLLAIGLVVWLCSGGPGWKLTETERKIDGLGQQMERLEKKIDAIEEKIGKAGKIPAEQP